MPNTNKRQMNSAGQTLREAKDLQLQNEAISIVNE
jgi:hypothetical protein